MHVRHKLHLSVVGLLLSLIACTSKIDKDTTIAEIGDLSISASEFEQHYLYNPFLTKYKTSAAAKNEILADLISQKLLAQANTSPNKIISDYTDQLHREAIIEQFWDEQISAQISITEAEIYDLYNRSNIQKNIRYFVFEEPGAANDAYKYISENNSFEKFAGLIGLNPTEIPKDTIVAGKSIPKLEDTVYAQQIGETSRPVKIGSKYFIINLQSEQKNMLPDRNDFLQQYSRLEKTLRSRKKEESYINFIKEKYPQPPYQLDRDVFKKMTLHIESQIDFSTVKNSRQPKNDLSGFEIKLDDLESMSIIEFNDGQIWSVALLGQRLRVSPYPVSLRSPGAFRKSIIAATKNILDDEILVREGMQKNMDNRTYVINQTTMWKDHLYALDYMQSQKSKFTGKRFVTYPAVRFASSCN